MAILECQCGLVMSLSDEEKRVRCRACGKTSFPFRWVLQDIPQATPPTVELAEMRRPALTSLPGPYEPGLREPGINRQGNLSHRPAHRMVRVDNGYRGSRASSAPPARTVPQDGESPFAAGEANGFGDELG